MSILASALARVCGDIQPTRPIRARMAARTSSTSASALALAAGGKYRATYSRPTASPIAPSTNVAARFTRSRCSGVPPMNRPWKSKLASTNRPDSSGAASSATLNACHAASVGSGVSANSSASFGIAVTCDTTTCPACPTPAASRNACQSNPGATSARARIVIGLYVFSRSRFCARLQCASATAVSNATTRPADPAGSSQPTSSSICPTYCWYRSFCLA